MMGYVNWQKDDDPDHDGEECVRCGADADGIAKYEFPERNGGATTYPYCRECAQRNHERFKIDHVVSGDLGLE